MESNLFLKPFTVTLVVVLAFLIALELYWRGRGFTPTYNDDKVLWAKARKELPLTIDQGTVFTGGSRIKFGLSVDTWEALTGERGTQLALVGTPPRAILRHLANDPNFAGKVIIDVAEGQFFALPDSIRRDKFATEGISYYKSETPAQKVSASIGFALESKLVFLEEGKFGFNFLASHLKIPDRPGIRVRPPNPLEFATASFNRQQSMTPMFLASPDLIKQQEEIWKYAIKMFFVPIKGDTLTALFEQYKQAIDKIRARGGTVVFIRPPSTGYYIVDEKKRFPREKYWDALLNYTNTPGIHFEDYPATAKLHCPEKSHLTPEGSIVYTTELVKTLQNEMRWKFPRKIESTAHFTQP